MQELWDHFSASWDKKPSTLARYGWAWQGQIKPAFGSRRIGSIQKAELVKFFSDVEVAKSRDARRKTQMLVHKLFAFAVHEDWLQRNPADNISAPIPERKEARFLTEAELKSVAEAMPERYRVMQGTSMATPHVTGCAALWAEDHGLRGRALWEKMQQWVRPLQQPATAVGAGLVQAPW